MKVFYHNSANTQQAFAGNIRPTLIAEGVITVFMQAKRWFT